METTMANASPSSILYLLFSFYSSFSASRVGGRGGRAADLRDAELHFAVAAGHVRPAHVVAEREDLSAAQTRANHVYRHALLIGARRARLNVRCVSFCASPIRPATVPLAA